VAWYRDSGTDWSGNGNDLTAVGSPFLVPGVGGGQAVSIGGGDGFSGTSVIPVVQPFSFGCFAQIDEDEVNQVLFQQTSTEDGFSVQLLLCTNGIIIWAANANTGPNAEGHTDTGWHQLFGTIDGSGSQTLYVDGVPVSTQRNDFATSPAIDDGLLQLGVDGQPFPIQFLGIWSRCLTPSEVLRLYGGGNGFDPTETLPG